MGERTRSWKHLADDLRCAMQESVQAMSDAELRVVAQTAKKATTTNCSWLTYEAAGIITTLAAHELCRRGLISPRIERNLERAARRSCSARSR